MQNQAIRVNNKNKNISYEITKDLVPIERAYIDVDNICATFIYKNGVICNTNFFYLDQKNEDKSVVNVISSSTFAKIMRFTYEIRWDNGIHMLKHHTIYKCTSPYYMNYNYTTNKYVLHYYNNIAIKIKTVSETNIKIVNMVAGKTGKTLKYENDKFINFDKKKMIYPQEFVLKIVKGMLDIIHDTNLKTKYYDDFIRDDIKMNKEKILAGIKKGEDTVTI